MNEILFETTFTTESEHVFDATFISHSEIVFSTEFTSGEACDFYEGSYDVVPSRQGQTLLTANKVMKKDVFITEIPYSSTSNLSGGQTFYIAKEFDE